MADGGNDEFPTVIGSDASFKGEMSFEKGLRVQGKFEGKLQSPGRLHVAREAKVAADVDAGAIIVEGEVRGNLNANDRVELKGTARYEGDLTASKLIVEEGAVFVGQVAVGVDGKQRQPQQGGQPRPQGQQGGQSGQPQPQNKGEPQKQG
jgi:cytoskeletal protein CcmA (bactofilin family)